MYDIIIVGGGIAGLMSALRIKEKQPDASILLLEKYKNLGGRALTYKENGIQYEIGAGRIWHKHERMNALVKQYGMEKYPIGTSSNFERTDNEFTKLFYPISQELLKIGDDLGHHTITDILPEPFLPVLEMYPYRAEMDLLRADLALPLFAPDELMGIVSDNAYYGLKAGYSALIDKIAADVRRAGVEIQTESHVDDVVKKGELFEVELSGSVLEAKKVIIATCRCSLSGFSVLSGLPLLTQLQTSALCRIYAVFPLPAWFADIPKTVTRNRLRYIIPINPGTGLIMISYTDGKDCEFWKDKKGPELESAILDAVRDLFPEKEIPAPTFLKKHYWPSGCTYWVPGDYEVATAQKEAMNPAPNLYVVGESVAIHQEWMESALDTVDILVSRYF